MLQPPMLTPPAGFPRVGPLVTHPAWCDRTRCDAVAGHADIRHVSSPETWRTAHDHATLSLSRYRSDTEDTVGELGCLLTVHNPDMAEQAEVVLNRDDLDRLVCARHEIEQGPTA